ncbi:fibronectin type III domain protein [Propionicimonas paludicola]|uniref:Fibronectin type III domain protein n=1 Tax=Propionicimonas paludicola TaxID=185243 RepID=A0A2A9CTY0_9ACTN|nr:fibronectin type III domain-containing protein [Propionicimonas paludicola]PFG17838.1 fibronectin type III domain protein [Propionicimonas paludicola]
MPKLIRRYLATLFAAALVAASAVTAATPSAAAPSYNVKVTARFTAVHLSWKSQGAGKTYQVQYSTSSTFRSAKSVTTSSTSTTINRLTSGKTWYFRVKAAGSSWSPKVSKKTSYPSIYDGNKVQKAYKISTDNVSGSSIDLTWSTPSGQFACFRIAVSPTPPGGQPSVQCTTAYTITGLARGTKYTIKLYTVAPAQSWSGISWPAIDITGASSSVSRTTSNYALAAPEELSLVTPQRTNRAKLTWTAPGTPLAEGDYYRVRLAANSAMTKSASWYAGTTTDTSLEVTGLSSDKIYYARVAVFGAGGKQRSDLSGYLMVKTLSRYGTLSGTVDSSAPMHDLVAVAYDSSFNIQDQADIAEDGSYQLRVLPGAIRVRITYLGSDNFASSWVSASGATVANSSGAAQYQVGNEVVVPVPEVTIGPAFSVSGKVTDAKTGSTVSGATVTISSVAGGRTETLSSTYSGGTFSFTGIPAGTYRIRLSYVGSATYRAVNYTLNVTGDVTGYVAKLPRK